MRPRALMIVGGSAIVGGIVLQQLFTTLTNAFLLSRGPMLDQTIYNALSTMAGLIAEVTVPLGAAILGAGIALHLAARPPRPDSPGSGQPEHDRLD